MAAESALACFSTLLWCMTTVTTPIITAMQLIAATAASSLAVWRLPAMVLPLRSRAQQLRVPLIPQQPSMLICSSPSLPRNGSEGEGDELHPFKAADFLILGVGVLAGDIITPNLYL